MKGGICGLFLQKMLEIGYGVLNVAWIHRVRKG
jgi:hypothetical protein